MKFHFTVDEYQHFINEFNWSRKENPEWRQGPSMFNALVRVRPDIANAILGTEWDMFYRDEQCDTFLQNIVLDY